MFWNGCILAGLDVNWPLNSITFNKSSREANKVLHCAFSRRCRVRFARRALSIVDIERRLDCKFSTKGTLTGQILSPLFLTRNSQPIVWWINELMSIRPASPVSGKLRQRFCGLFPLHYADLSQDPRDGYLMLATPRTL